MPSHGSLDSSSPPLVGRTGASGALDRIRRCVPGVRRWAHGRLPRWARSIADTSDLVQDAVVKTIGRLDALDDRGRDALAAYLREAVANRIRDEHRRFARRGTSDALAETLRDAAPSPLDRTMASEMHARYVAALARLGPEDRELIVAHVELEYTHEQLACMTGRTPNAARMALHRAVARLAEQLRER
jgi:RNA polymerase sigma factor (sigma-70 family)